MSRVPERGTNIKMSTKWAPIVHARTFEVDFRSNLLACPEVFSQDEIAWAKPFILSAMDSADDLVGNPRWVFLQNDRFRICGMVSEATQVASKCTHDVQGRENYGFFGYVAKLPCRELPPREVGVFAPLYKLVISRWEEKRYDTDRNRATKTQFEIELIEAPTSPTLKAINSDVNLCRLFPRSDERAIWSSLELAEGHASACLGLKRRNSGTFLNVSLEKQSSVEDIPTRRARPPEDVTRSSDEKRGVQRPNVVVAESFFDTAVSNDRPPDSREKEPTPPFPLNVIESVLGSLKQGIRSLFHSGNVEHQPTTPSMSREDERGRSGFATESIPTAPSTPPQEVRGPSGSTTKATPMTPSRPPKEERGPSGSTSEADSPTLSIPPQEEDVTPSKDSDKSGT